MQKKIEISWPIVVAEGVAIVASILLAFAIDAWWQRRAQLEQTADLVASLHADFTASQMHLEQWLSGYMRTLKALTEFRNKLRDTSIGNELLVSEELIVAAIGAPTYSPIDAILESAISSGQIEHIEDVELRNQLSLWRQQLDDTQEDEILIREVVVHHLVPTLSDQVRLGFAFEFDTIVGWFLGNVELKSSDSISVTSSSRLEAAIAEKVFYTTFVVGGLEELEQTQAGILRLLEDRARDN